MFQPKAVLIFMSFVLNVGKRIGDLRKSKIVERQKWADIIWENISF